MCVCVCAHSQATLFLPNSTPSLLSPCHNANVKLRQYRSPCTSSKCGKCATRQCQKHWPADTGSSLLAHISVVLGNTGWVRENSRRAVWRGEGVSRWGRQNGGGLDLGGDGIRGGSACGILIPTIRVVSPTRVSWMCAE